MVVDGWYRLTCLLGSGSFGDGFEAAEEVLGEYIARVAVKVLRPKNSAEQEAVLREVRGLARFGNPHIPAYRTAGQVADGDLAGTVFLVAELAETSLEQALKQPGRLPGGQIHAMALGIAQALDFCHQSGAIHGDVKPANVFRVQGAWKLGDFGLVRAVRSGQEFVSFDEATCAHMAPELCQGRASTKSDVYSLGVTILEALTGEVAHRGATREEFLQDLASQPARIPEGLPAPWSDLLARSLDRDPEVRCTASEMVAALSGGAEDAPSPAKGPDVVIVSSLGHGDCLLIADALRSARPGTRIVVRPGHYRERPTVARPKRESHTARAGNNPMGQ